MKEAILSFRKVCAILLKNRSQRSIYEEMGVSGPTLIKLLKDDISEIKIRASLMGMIQDFCKKHVNDVNYAGVEPAPDSVVNKEFERLRKTGSNYHLEKEKKKPEPEKTVAPEELKESLPPCMDALIDVLNRLSKELPSNVAIHIVINEK